MIKAYLYVYRHAEFISASAAWEGERLQSVMVDPDIPMFRNSMTRLV